MSTNDSEQKTILFNKRATQKPVTPIEQLTQKQQRALANTPKRYFVMTHKAYSGVLSKSKAIGAKCAECVGFEEVTERVKTCTVSSCPLWHYRPYQS